MSSFRERFPPPWSIEETDRRIYVVDRRGVRIVTIELSPHDNPNRHLGWQFSQVSRRHGRALAKAICWLGNAP